MTPRSRGLGGHSPQQIQALLDQGFSQRALAQRLGLTHQPLHGFAGIGLDKERGDRVVDTPLVEVQQVRDAEEVLGWTGEATRDAHRQHREGQETSAARLAAPRKPGGKEDGVSMAGVS